MDTATIINAVGGGIVAIILFAIGQKSLFGGWIKNWFKFKERQMDEQTEGYERALKSYEDTVKLLIAQSEKNIKEIMLANEKQLIKIESLYIENSTKQDKEIKEEKDRSRNLGIKVQDLEVEVAKLRVEMESVKKESEETKKDRDTYKKLLYERIGISDLKRQVNLNSEELSKLQNNK